MEFKINAYDFEITKDWWCVSFLDEQGNYTTFQQGQELDLIDYIIKNKKDTIFVGYNNVMFDDYCLKCIWYNVNPYKVVEKVILEKGWPWEIEEIKFKKNLDIMSFDLLRIIGKQAPSLKDIEGHLGVEIKMDKTIQDKKIEGLTNEEKEEMIKYNRHDVYVTKLLYDILKPELDAYLLLMKKFNLPSKLLKKKKAQIFELMYEGKLKTSLNPYKFKYKAPSFIKLYDDKIKKDMESFEFTEKNEFEDSIEWDGFSFDIGRGGAHYAKKNYIQNFDGEKILVLNDFSSFYPGMMANPTNEELRYIDPMIDWKIVRELIDMRLEAKNTDKKLANALKIVINSIYGKTIADSNKYRYWPAGLSICLTGQLITIMICQELKHQGIGKLIQVNTDGFYYELNKNELDKFNEIMDKFQKEIGIDFERDIINFGKIVQKDVNNYIIYDSETKHCKVKGALVKKYGNKQTFMYNSKPIIDEAIVNYFLFDTPINKTIMDAFLNNEAKKFQVIYNMKGENFEGCYLYKEGQVERIQPINRGFASSDKNLWELRELYKNGTYRKFPNAPEHVFIWNENLDGLDIRKINLDIQWYIDLAEKGVEMFLKKE